MRVIRSNNLKTIRAYKSSRNIPSLRLLKINNLKLRMLLSVMDTSDTFTLKINHYVCFMGDDSVMDVNKNYTYTRLILE